MRGFYLAINTIFFFFLRYAYVQSLNFILKKIVFFILFFSFLNNGKINGQILKYWGMGLAIGNSISPS